MKFVVIAFVFACFCLIDHVSSEIHDCHKPKELGCSSHHHCPENCYCYKKTYEQVGSCTCQVQAGAMEVCWSNHQCNSKSSQGHCWCDKPHQQSQHGYCKCL